MGQRRQRLQRLVAVAVPHRRGGARRKDVGALLGGQETDVLARVGRAVEAQGGGARIGLVHSLPRFGDAEVLEGAEAGEGDGKWPAAGCAVGAPVGPHVGDQRLAVASKRGLVLEDLDRSRVGPGRGDRGPGFSERRRWNVADRVDHARGRRFHPEPISGGRTFPGHRHEDDDENCEHDEHGAEYRRGHGGGAFLGSFGGSTSRPGSACPGSLSGCRLRLCPRRGGCGRARPLRGVLALLTGAVALRKALTRPLSRGFVMPVAVSRADLARRVASTLRGLAAPRGTVATLCHCGVFSSLVPRLARQNSAFSGQDATAKPGRTEIAGASQRRRAWVGLLAGAATRACLVGDRRPRCRAPFSYLPLSQGQTCRSPPGHRWCPLTFRRSCRRNGLPGPAPAFNPRGGRGRGQRAGRRRDPRCRGALHLVAAGSGSRGCNSQVARRRLSSRAPPTPPPGRCRPPVPS